MFYTKYRPQKFSEISKPNEVADALSMQVKTAKTAHAYLFVGPRGTGKTTTARILAKALNCTNLSTDGDPCAECAQCIAIANGNFLDLIEIDAASNRGIDDIRDLKEKIKLAPSSGKCKVYIIDEVHMLTSEAFNALLKTLEEPPVNTTFILCTTELHKVPDTIKSRCQVFKFKRATVTQLTEKLKKIAASEGVSLSDADLRQIATAVHGGFRDAETLLQQVIEGGIPTSALLNVGTYSSYATFVEYLFVKDTKSALHHINKLYLDGIDLYVWTGELLKYLRDLMFILVNAEDGLVDLSEELLAEMKKQAKSVNINTITSQLFVFEEASRGIKNSFITQLPLELAIVKVCTTGGENAHDLGDAPAPSAPLNTKPSPAKLAEPKKVPELPKKIDSMASTNHVPAESIVKIVETTSTVVVVDSEAAYDETINIDVVRENWVSIVAELSSINNTTAALLKACNLTEAVGGALHVEVPFDFHKERMETTKNRDLIEKAIAKVTGLNAQIVCTVKKREADSKKGESGKLTDYNVMVPSGMQSPQSKEELLGIFDGGLPF